MTGGLEGWQKVGVVAGVIGAAASVIVPIAIWLADNNDGASGPTNTPPTTIADPPINTTRSQSPIPLGDVDFASWESFGGIDAQPSADGRSVRLDTHDTVATWTTKWSGLIAPGTTPICDMRMTGRVRDLSHSMGVQGGFGLGLGTLSATKTELTGIAVQFDYAFEGYRTVDFPSDLATPVVPANLDNEWHDIDLHIDAGGATTLQVDGSTTVQSKGAPVCGYPVIRVWGGAAEFSDFRITGGS